MSQKLTKQGSQSSKNQNAGYAQLVSANHIYAAKDVPILAQQRVHNHRTPKLRNPFVSHHLFIKKLRNCPLNKYGMIIIIGFFEYNPSHQNSTVSSSKIRLNRDVAKVCKQYLYDTDDEIYQLALIVHLNLRKVRKKSLTMALLNKFITFYLGLKDIDKNTESQIAYFRNKLIESKFIELVDNRCNLYQVSMEARVAF